MQTIVIIDGQELRDLLQTFADAHNTGAYRLRIDQRGNGVAIKINEGMWSPTIGRAADQGGY